MKLLRSAILLALLGLIVAETARSKAQPPEEKDEQAWEVVRIGNAGIAVPKRWRVIEARPSQMVLYRQATASACLRWMKPAPRCRSALL